MARVKRFVKTIGKMKPFNPGNAVCEKNQKEARALFERANLVIKRLESKAWYTRKEEENNKAYAEAIELYNKAIELNPSPLFYLHRGNIYASMKRTKAYLEAFKDFSKAIEIDPSFIPAYLARGQIRVEVFDDTKEALEDYAKITEIDPSFIPAYLASGRLLKENYEKEEALKEFDKAIKIDPTSKEAYLARAETLKEMIEYKFDEEYGAADEELRARWHEDWLATIKKLIELEPEKNSHRLTLINILEELDRTDEIIEVYNQALKQDPKDMTLYRDRSRYHEKAGNLEQAIKDLEKFLEDDAPAWRSEIKNLARLKEKAGMHTEAVLDYEKYLEKDPKDENAIESKAKVELKLGLLKEALTGYNTLIKKSPKSAELYKDRAEIRAEMGKLKLAIQDYNKAIEKSYYYNFLYAKLNDKIIQNKFLSELFSGRGSIKLKQKKPQEALEDFKDAVFCNRLNKEVLSKLMQLCKEIGEEELLKQASEQYKGIELVEHYENLIQESEALKRYEHEQAYEKEITQDPDASELFTNCGEAILKISCELYPAIKNFEIAIDLNPKNQRAHLGLIRTFKQRGQISLAKEAYKKYKEIGGKEEF